jgi:hypothetical protein
MKRRQHICKTALSIFLIGMLLFGLGATRAVPVHARVVALRILPLTDHFTYVGGKMYLDAVTYPSKESVTWNSSNLSVATIDAAGGCYRSVRRHDDHHRYGYGEPSVSKH